MAQDYTRNISESKADFEKRCKELRKKELLDNSIEIIYSIDSSASSEGEVTFIDRIMMNKFANIYGNISKQVIDDSMGNYREADNYPISDDDRILDDKEYEDMVNESMNTLNQIISETNLTDDKKKIEQLEKSNIEQMNIIMDERKNYKKEVDAIKIKSRIEQDAILAKKKFEESIETYTEESKSEDEEDIYKSSIFNSSNQFEDFDTKRKKEEEAFLKKEKKQEQQLLKKIKKEKKLLKKEEERKKKEEEKKNKSSKKDEERKIREFQKAQEREEARIEEELLENNLYPKPKNFKDL